MKSGIEVTMNISGSLIEESEEGELPEVTIKKTAFQKSLQQSF